MSYQRELEKELNTILQEIERGYMIAEEDPGMFGFFYNFKDDPDKIDRYINGISCPDQERIARRMVDAINENQLLVDRVEFIQDELTKVRNRD